MPSDGPIITFAHIYNIIKSVLRVIKLNISILREIVLSHSSQYNATFIIVSDKHFPGVLGSTCFLSECIIVYTNLAFESKIILDNLSRFYNILSDLLLGIIYYIITTSTVEA